MQRFGTRLIGCTGALLLVLTACSEEEPGSMVSTTSVLIGTSGSADGSTSTTGSTGAGGTTSTTGGTGSTTGFVPVTTNGGAGSTTSSTSTTTGSAGTTTGTQVDAGSGTATTGGDAGGGTGDTPFTGPVDGDPSKPMVEIDGVPCGAPRAGFGATPPSVQIGGRDVVVAYPCAHEDAAVTFFLFLHGTLQEGQKVPFTMRAFPIHEYVDSDNFIVVVPEAVGSQWGNGDNGQDLPHLYEVVDWVYETFGEKFNIRSMWASGGSWGAFYLNRTFACDPMFEGRLKGVRMVVGTGCPACSDRLSCIVAKQELEEGSGSTLSEAEQEMLSDSNIGQFASAHGCGEKQKMPDLGPVRHWTWPDCDPGWAHSFYLGPGEHADPWNDPTAMDYMVQEIKSTEP